MSAIRRAGAARGSGTAGWERRLKRPKGRSSGSAIGEHGRRTARTLRTVVAAFLTTILGVSLVGVAVVPAAAVTDTNPDFILIEEDLEHILKQIQIAEAHAAGKGLLCREPTDTSGKCVTDPALPLGLRTVDGSFNNLVNPAYGAADRHFPRLLAAEWRSAGERLPAAEAFLGTTTAEHTAMCGDAPTCYAQEQGNVYDTEPRVISNLIVDQTTSNPAAVNAALNTPGSTVTDPADGLAKPVEDYVDADGALNLPPNASIFIPNTAPDEALSAPFNAWFTFFGQFFDHGLDLVNKGGNGTLVVPLKPGDPLYGAAGSHGNFLMLTRATQYKDADGNVQHNNQTTPFIDQNQTYTSHRAHQVFLREYALGDHDNDPTTSDAPMATGRLLNSPTGGLPTWADVKDQAREVLGIALGAEPGADTGDYPDVTNVPQVVADQYGNFTPDPTTGFPLLVTDEGNKPGNLANPVSTDNALRTNHAFLDDIAHGAAPDHLGGYDNVALDEHFITGDGRGNENIGLTSVHHVFHAEHNRMVGEIKEILDDPDNAELKKAFQGVENNYQELLGEPTIPDGPEADDWSYEERLFQAAKFPTEMQYQHLVFEEFARKIQPEIDAIVLNENSYDATIDPAIVAEYAHVVYRFGHSMLTEDVQRRGSGITTGSETVSLLDAFLNPQSFHFGGEGAPTLSSEQAAGYVINGTTNQVGNQIDEFVTDTLRNNLLGLPLDLATINLVRARDVGTPSLQTARETFFKATGDPVLKPYANWVDFGLNLKNGDNFGRTPDLECEIVNTDGSTGVGADASDPRCQHPNASLVNFVAAYGTHPDITGVDMEAENALELRRQAADAIVNGDDPEHREFMTGTGAWLDVETGLDDVDFWVGGLAEALNPFGGMLGSTFNFVFEQQLENLQFGDRFYYLFRNQGNQLFAALENNSFAKLIKRNTEASLLPADIFAIQDPFIDLEALPADQSQWPEGLVLMPDGTYRWDGDEHIEIHGFRTLGADASDPPTAADLAPLADKIEGGQGDDALWGYAGHDRIEGRSGNDSIIGGEGDDILTDDFGFDNIKGGWGHDAIRVGAGEDLILGGHGNDFVQTSTDFKTVFSGTGNDILTGGSGRETSFAGEGDDWVEGGAHADLLQGDNANQFQNNPHGGDDVIDGGAGNDDMEGEGGDDILIGRPNGTDRMEGMHGYDFVTYRGDTEGVDVDLRFTTLQRPDNQAVRDRFDLIEAVSGGGGNDVIRGMGTSVDDIPDSDINKHKMTEDTLNMIDGLRGLLDPGHAQDYTDRFRPATIGFDTDGESNLLLGGAGSDLFEGRVGDDFIDGDAYLDVLLEATDVDGIVKEYSDPTNTELQDKIFSGAINPEKIEIVRRIADADDAADTAIYTAHRSQYTITDLGDGYWRVAHDQTDTEGEEAEGRDIIRNIEMLRFSNGCYMLATINTTGESCGDLGRAWITYTGDAPEEDVPVTGTVEIDLSQVQNVKDIEFQWMATDFEDVNSGGADWLTAAVQDIDESSCTTAGDVMTCAAEFTPGDAEFDTALRLEVTFLEGSECTADPISPCVQRSIVSQPTDVGVVGRPDPGTGLVIGPQPAVEGQRISASGLQDNDGLEEAGETLLWQWETAGSSNAPGAEWELVACNIYSIRGYIPSNADVGKYLRMRVTYTDDHGNAEDLRVVTAETVQDGGTVNVDPQPGPVICPDPSGEGGGAQPVAPAPVSVLSATSTVPGQVNLVWDAPANDGGSPLTGFVIEVFTAGALVDEIPISDAAARTHLVTGLTAGTEYTFGVYATNAAGSGPSGDTRTATVADGTDTGGDTGGGDTGGGDTGGGDTGGGDTGGGDTGGGDGGTGEPGDGGTGGDGGADPGTGGNTAAVFRMAGEDRYATAAEIATASFDPADVDRVLLAVGDRFPDGLAGGPLAVSGGDPLLLTKTDKLPKATEDALRELSPSSVVALGDTGAVSDQVLQQAAAAAGADSTERIGGANRYETAALIAAELPAPKVVYLAVGNNFPDSLAGGAATNGAPILLTAPNSLPQATADALAAMKPERVVALGGPSSVPDSVLAAAAEAAGGATVDRMAGDDRYGTSVAIAEAMYPASTFSGTVYVAVGSNFPDSLSASSAAASEGAPLLLTRTDRLPDEVARWLAQVNGLKRVVVLGGPGTVSPGVMAQLDALID